MSKKKKRRLLQLSPETKRIALLAVGIAVIIGVLATVLILINQPRTEDNGITLTDEQKKVQEQNVNQATREGALRDDAAAALKKGNAEEANKIYEQAIESESDTARKVSLYLQQSGVYYDQDKVKEAIAVAKKAETISDDKFLVADWLSRIYEDQKQYKLSAQYYNLAADWADSPTNKTGLGEDFYRDEASRVASLEKKK
jgi:tetratricopeptide (TPR) repeat protein